MTKQSKYLTLSLVAHLVGIIVLSPLFINELNIGQHRISDSDAYRRESINLAVAVNTMKRIEESLTGEASNPHKLAVSYEELTKLSDSEIANRALDLQTEISRSIVKQSDGSPNEERRKALAPSGVRQRIRDIIQSGDRTKLVREIEMMVAESQLAASSSTPSIETEKAAIRVASPVPNLEESSSGVSGIDLADTLRYDSLVGSRFLEGGIGADVWSYVDSWYILGPIEKEQSLYRKDRIEFNLDKRFPIGRTSSSSWEYAITDSPAIALSKNKNPQAYFLYSELFAEKEQEVVFWLRGTDNAKLWVNNRADPSIVSHERDLGESFCVVTLNRGFNSLELRIDSSGSHGYLWLVHSNQIAKALREL